MLVIITLPARTNVTLLIIGWLKVDSRLFKDTAEVSCFGKKSWDVKDDALSQRMFVSSSKFRLLNGGLLWISSHPWISGLRWVSWDNDKLWNIGDESALQSGAALITWMDDINWRSPFVAFWRLTSDEYCYSPAMAYTFAKNKWKSLAPPSCYVAHQPHN